VIRLFILSATVLLSGCPLKKLSFSLTKKKGIYDVTTYDILPPAPVPPENYCYELNQGNNGIHAVMRITIMGDSVFGTLDYANSPGSQTKGKISGTIFDSTILASYKTAENMKGVDEEWKLRGDSIFMRTSEIIPRDTPQAGLPDSIHAIFSPALHKVACK
jgi:hypothetical protein